GIEPAPTAGVVDAGLVAVAVALLNGDVEPSDRAAIGPRRRATTNLGPAPISRLITGFEAATELAAVPIAGAILRSITEVAAAEIEINREVERRTTQQIVGSGADAALVTLLIREVDACLRSPLRRCHGWRDGGNQNRKGEGE